MQTMEGFNSINSSACLVEPPLAITYLTASVVLISTQYRPNWTLWKVQGQAVSWQALLPRYQFRHELLLYKLESAQERFSSGNMALCLPRLTGPNHVERSGPCCWPSKGSQYRAMTAVKVRNKVFIKLIFFRMLWILQIYWVRDWPMEICFVLA